VNKLARLAALGGLVALGACATSAATPTATSTPGVWLDSGSQYSVTIKAESTSTFFGQSSDLDFTTTLGLETLRGGSDQRWRWTIANFSIDAMDLGEEFPIQDLPLKDVSEILAPIVRLMLLPGFECKVDANGSCAELTNWSTWRGGLEDTILIFVEILDLAPLFSAWPGAILMDDSSNGIPAPSTTPDPEAENVKRAVDFGVNVLLNLLEGVDPKSAGAATMAGPWGPFMLQGADLNRTGSMNFTMTQALPFNGGALHFTGTRSVEAVDRASGTATVASTLKLDEKAMFASLLKIYDTIVTPNLAAYAKFDPENGQMAQMFGAMIRTQVEAALTNAAFSWEVTTRGKVDLQTGMATESRSEYRGGLKGGGDFDWIEGSFTGSYVATITPGAPIVQRLTRRDVQPLLKVPGSEMEVPLPPAVEEAPAPKK
jgi:hypothetical protein